VSLLRFPRVPYVTHTPSGVLSRFVDYFWWLSDAPVHQQERIVPTGTLELVINLNADLFEIRGSDEEACAKRFSGAMVSGAYGRYFVIDTRAHASLLGIHFKPGAARTMLGPPLGELADLHVDLEQLWGPLARELRERLATATDPAARFLLLEEALLSRLARTSTAPHAAVAAALHQLSGGRPSIGEVSAGLGLSRRRFIELFTAEVGMTPKLYARVQRFQAAVLLAQRSAPDWSALAQAAGYCDQSHLIRDFMSFSGFSPTELLRHSGPRLKEHHVSHG